MPDYDNGREVEMEPKERLFEKRIGDVVVSLDDHSQEYVLISSKFGRLSVRRTDWIAVVDAVQQVIRDAINERMGKPTDSEGK